MVVKSIKTVDNLFSQTDVHWSQNHNWKGGIRRNLAGHTVPEFHLTWIYSERFFLYISFCIHHRISKFCENIHLGKNNIFTKFDHFLRSLRADVEKRPLRINLGWAKFWNSVGQRLWLLHFSDLYSLLVLRRWHNFIISVTSRPSEPAWYLCFVQ